MSLFIETLRVEADNTIPLLSYHQSRMSRTLSTIEGSQSIDLTHFLETQLPILSAKSPAVGRVRKLRIVYSTSEVTEVSLKPYQLRPTMTLGTVPITFDYSFKYADRIEINSSYHSSPETDDILMTVDGHLSDTSYGNIALLDGNSWYTPDTPLLEGCRRAYLIDRGLIKAKKIRIEAINSYSYLMIFNAMIPFGRILIPIRHLQI